MKARLPGGFEFTLGQAALATGIVAYSVAMPGDLRYKLDALGFGVCHQIHTHSFTIGGHQLPLCARCTGIYLGALAGVGLLSVLRRRAVRLPAWNMVAILAIFFAAMVMDGLNSTLQTLGGGLWDSTNLLRLFTGALSGIAAACIFYPIFNMSMWDSTVVRRERVLERPMQLVGVMAVAGVLVGLVLSGGDWLFYPLAVLGIVGMLTLLTMANSMFVMMVTRREAQARSFSNALTPMLLGLCASLVMLTLLAWGRSSLAFELSSATGMPLVPGLP